jgi:hypothetical protein
MTQYIYQLSVAVPESLTECANHLAAYLGGTEADLLTYANARYTDGTTDYHFLATVVTATALQRVAAPSDLPEFVDPSALAQALAALVLVQHDGESELPAAQSDKIVAYIGVSPEQSISEMGITLKPEIDNDDTP